MSKMGSSSIHYPETNIGLVKSRLKKIDTTFPSLWKQAEVIPIEKVANPSEAKDSPPISLLYHCSKIAEYFLMKEYKKQILPRVNKNQLAYQKRLGTVDALVYNLDNWTQMLDSKNTVAVNVVFKDHTYKLCLYTLEEHKCLILTS